MSSSPPQRAAIGSSSRRRVIALAALTVAVAALALTSRPSPRDALRHIVQDQCLPHWRERHSPAPCERVSANFALLADRKGGAHFLLIATRTITGIEDPIVLRPDTPNYFAAAWRARDRLDAFRGHVLARDAVGLAINSALARGQDQLHIHIECLGARLQRVLQATAAQVGDHWAPLPSPELPYLARHIRGSDLDAANPFLLLAEDWPESRARMGDYTIVVAPIDLADGPGFILLAGRTPTRAALMAPGPRAQGLVPPGETLLDSACTLDNAPASGM